MWQVLLAAAVAGSGFFVKRLRSVNAPEHIIVSDQKRVQPKHPDNSSDTQLSAPPPRPSDYSRHNTETQSSNFYEESIFRFSSASGGNGARNLRKKLGCGSRGIRGNGEGIKNVDVEKFEKNCGVLKNGSEGLVVDQRKNGKKFAVCLKKRRTSKNASAKCESCASKDDSSFAWGLGVGLMYMMSAGKAEISRLNTAMDETTKVVQELKTDIAKRKSSRNLDVLSLRAVGNANPKKSRGKHARAVLTKSSTENRDDIRVYGCPVSDEGECGSSVLTEEPQSEVLEMDQLEAELESELQKLPWCTTEASGPERRSSDFVEIEVLPEEFNKLDSPNLKSYQHNGVMPSELDQKLCHVLIEQQESQIVELESELQRSHSKLNEKEGELQALKDCVRRLTKFSLGSASDEETGAQGNEEENIDWVHEKMGPESKKSVVGIKRAMAYESNGCCTK